MSQNHWAPLRGETSAPLRRLARSTNETWVSLVRKQKKSKKHIVQSLPKACSLQNHFSHWHFSASASYHKHVNVANGQSSSIESRSMDDTERSKLLRLLVYNIPQDSSVAAWCAHISSQAMSGAAERLIASLHFTCFWSVSTGYRHQAVLVWYVQVCTSNLVNASWDDMMPYEGFRSWLEWPPVTLHFLRSEFCSHTIFYLLLVHLLERAFCPRLLMWVTSNGTRSSQRSWNLSQNCDCRISSDEDQPGCWIWCALKKARGLHHITLHSVSLHEEK